MTSLGGLLFLIYAVYALSAHFNWYADVAPPLARLGLEHSSAAKVKPDVRVLFSGSYDTHDDVVAKIAGPLLVDERLVLYPDVRKAEAQISKVVNAARRDQAGFSRILVGCPSGCRNARVKRIGTLVVLLVNRYSSENPQVRAADTALAELTDRYARSSGVRRLIEPDGSVGQALVLMAVLYLLFLPFVTWQAWCMLRGQRTPYRDGGFGTLARVTDVCSAARSSRRYGYLLLGVRTALFAAGGAFGGFVSAGLLSENYWFVATAIAPIVWLLSRPFTRKRRRIRITNTQWLRLSIESRSGVLGLLGALALAAAAALITLAAWVWGFSWLAIVAPGVVQSLLFDPTGSAAASPENAFRIVALLCVFYGGFAFITAVNRLGRRVRWTAAAVRAKKLGYPVVLYLRDFRDDARLVAAGDVISHPANEIFSFRARIPYEEVIGQELSRNGPVLAIAEPGSPRAFLPLGASRKWLLDREWRDAVRREMSHAVLIIIAVGATEGLLWEVMTATREGLLDKVILLMPPDKDDALRKRWAATANAIRTAGGPALDLAVDPACLLAMQVSATGPRQVMVSDRRDEYSYHAALDVALTSPATATVTAAWITNRMAKAALRETPPRSDQLSTRPRHLAFAEISRLSWAFMHRLPPARRRTKPWLAVLLAVFLNGVGIALYFRRRVDILAGLALGWPLFLLPGLLSELGQSGQSSGPATEQAAPWWFWLWLGICALYAYLRAYSSNERLSAADAGRPPGTQTEADDVDGSDGGASA